MVQSIDLHPDMTPEERIEALARVSMKTPEHLKRWLQTTGRTWLVFNALDLVDSLRWPEGVDLLMQIIACYKDHRATIETGRYETQVEPVSGKEVQVPLFKGEPLEIEELDRAIRALIELAVEKDRTWKLENPPM